MKDSDTRIQFVWFSCMVAFSALMFSEITFIHPFYFYIPAVFTINFIIFGKTGFIKTTYFFFSFSVILILGFLLMKIKYVSVFRAGTDPYVIKKVYGFVLYDSSFTQSNNHIMTIYACSADTVYGQTVSCSGIINIVGKEKAVITSGIKIAAEGAFSENLFICDNIQVLSRSVVNDIREYLISRIEIILLKNGNAEPAFLSMMLLLGRSEDYGSSVKDLAKECGCTHVLALSGMHLNVICMLFKPVKNRHLKRFLSLSAGSVFLFIAGPRPSLIRAFLMMLFSELPTFEKIILSYILQTVLFPFSMINQGCIYSYLAIFALSVISPILTGVLESVLPRKMSGSVGTTVSVLLLISPLELVKEGVWYPVALIAGPVMGFLITLSMIMGIVLLCTVNPEPLSELNGILYDVIVKVLSFFSGFGNAGSAEYVFTASAVLLIICIFFLLRRIRRKRYGSFISKYLN